MTDYKWADGYRHKGVNAAEVASELDRIATETGLTATTVVEAAKDKKSVLHPLFEWDDAKAADIYRRQQANVLVRAVVEVSPYEPEHRAFVLASDGSSTEYRRIHYVISDDAMFKDAVARLRADLDGIQGSIESIFRLANDDATKPIRRVQTHVKAAYQELQA